MKKSSQNPNTNTLTKGLNENKRLLSRSQPTLPTLHPWYYVKGRKDITEKNISSRREREDQKYNKSVCDNKYFAKSLAENQIFDKWKDNKSLVKHPKQAIPLRPPFDVSEETKANDKHNFGSDKELEKKYLKGKEKMKQFLHKFNEMNENYNELEKRQNILVFQLNQLMATKTWMEEKKELFEYNNKRLVCMRFSRDKLRKKVFEVADQLIYYKKCIQSIDLKDTKHVLTDGEWIQLTEVMERAVNIMDLYIDLNHSRNNEIQTLYDEEADDRWEQQEEDWTVEYEVWNVMVEKLMDSFKNILKDKLSQLLTEMNVSLEEREQLVKQLTTFTARIKSEPKLSILLSQNINDLLTEVNEN